MMLRNLVLVVVGVLSGVTAVRFAHAQGAAAEAAPGVEPAPGAVAAPTAGPTAPSDGHATGFMVQARVQTQTSLLSLSGGSGFLVGYQGPSFSLGLGLGLNRIGISAPNSGDSASLTLFQIAPTAMVDVWHSADGRARANLVGSVGYGRASFASTVQSQVCTINALGAETCTTSNQDSSLSASLIPVMVGFGGDYFLSRNFALGAEFGLQALFVTGVNATYSNGTSGSVDAAADTQFGYGALRATLVLGD